MCLLHFLDPMETSRPETGVVAYNLIFSLLY